MLLELPAPVLLTAQLPRELRAAVVRVSVELLVGSSPQPAAPISMDTTPTIEARR